MIINYTDKDYIKVGNKDWHQYSVYCDGEKVNLAQEASAEDGWVKYCVEKKSGRCEYKFGNVQILCNHEEENKFQIDFINETIIVNNKVLTGPIKAIQKYQFNI